MNAPFQSKRSLIRRTVVGLVAAAVFGMMGLFFLSWRPTIAAIERPNPAWPIARANQILHHHRHDLSQLLQLAEVPKLAGVWVDELLYRAEQLKNS